MFYKCKFKTNNIIADRRREQRRIQNPVKHLRQELFCENCSRLLAVNYIYKKLHLRSFDWPLNTPQRMNTNKICIAAYQTYLQYFRQNLSLAPPLQFQERCQMVFCEKFFQSFQQFKQTLILLRQNHVCPPKSRGIKQKRSLSSSATSNFKIYVKKVSKGVESKKQHKMWIQIRKFKYSISNIQNLGFSYRIL